MPGVCAIRRPAGGQRGGLLPLKQYQLLEMLQLQGGLGWQACACFGGWPGSSAACRVLYSADNITSSTWRFLTAGSLGWQAFARFGGWLLVSAACYVLYSMHRAEAKEARDAHTCAPSAPEHLLTISCVSALLCSLIRPVPLALRRRRIVAAEKGSSTSTTTVSMTRTPQSLC